jgi:hypothetical protein
MVVPPEDVGPAVDTHPHVAPALGFRHAAEACRVGRRLPAIGARSRGLLRRVRLRARWLARRGEDLRLGRSQTTEATSETRRLRPTRGHRRAARTGDRSDQFAGIRRMNDGTPSAASALSCLPQPAATEAAWAKLTVTAPGS